MKKLTPWLGAAAIITIIFGTMYTLGQQSLRLNANDPQMQLAEDVAAQLDQGVGPYSLVSGQVDMGVSLAPFVIIYDGSGHMVAGSGYLHGKVPVVPYGVLAHATPAHHNWVTWQPEPGVRLATVEVAARNYYVLGGRSLRQVENREDDMFKLAVLGWLGSMVVLGGAFTLNCNRVKPTAKHTK